MKLRLLAVAGIIVLQLTVPVLFGASPLSSPPYHDTESMYVNGEQIVGEEAQVYGQVQSLDPVVVRHDREPEGAIYITITDIDRDVSVDSYIEVYGIVTGETTVKAMGIVVRDEREHWYTYGISFLAVLLVLTIVARTWRFDRTNYTFIPAE